MSGIQKMTERLNQAACGLTAEHRVIFDDMVVYIRCSNLKTKDAEEFLQQILDSFLLAQEKGATIQTVLGTPDIEAYCREVVKAYKDNYFFHSRISEYLMYGGMVFAILSAINLVIENLGHIVQYGLNGFSMQMEFTAGTFFNYIFIGIGVIAIFRYIKKSCFKNEIKPKQNIWKLRIMAAAAVGCIGLVDYYLNQIVLFYTYAYIVLPLGLAVYLSGKYLTDRY